MNKYNNKKTEIDGIVFDSKKEANRYQELKLLERAGKISDLTLQPEFELQEAFEKHGKKFRPIKYKADFSYIEINEDQYLNKVIVEDTKGFRTKEFELKYKMFEHKYPSLKLEVI